MIYAIKAANGYGLMYVKLLMICTKINPSISFIVAYLYLETMNTISIMDKIDVFMVECLDANT